MKKLSKYKRLNESGLTLVEILISIAIITIILLVILFVLLQIIRTNKTSQEIVSATYIAQTEMEKMYAVSQKQDFDSWISSLQHDDKEHSTDGTSDIITYETNDQFNIEMKITDVDDFPLKRIIIYVYDMGSTEHPKAKMENLLDWGLDDE